MLHYVREFMVLEEEHICVEPKQNIGEGGRRNSVKGAIIAKPEVTDHILICYHPLANMHVMNIAPSSPHETM